MKLKLWQVDAFTDKVLAGNPAAVVPLESWLDAALMQAIAAENNLAETAFFVKTAPGAYDLRWFTPNSEVDLCGHATLASADVIFRFLDPDLNEVRFQTRSGELKVTRGGRGRQLMSMPAASVRALHAARRLCGSALAKALNAAAPKELHFSSKGGAGAGALIAVWNSPAEIKALKPSGDLEAICLK